jgi:hypothetical protein
VVADRLVPLDVGGGGFPVLSAMVMACQEVAATISDELEQMQAAKCKAAYNAQGDERVDSLLLGETSVAEELSANGIHIFQGEPIADRKSTFLAHVARVHSVDEVRLVVEALRGNRQIASAAHPTIVAYRFRAANGGVLHQDSDDDGETGASKKLQFLLERHKLDGVLLVVTRWFGGILLGPDRFRHIMACAKQALQLHKFI